MQILYIYLESKLNEGKLFSIAQHYSFLNKTPNYDLHRSTVLVTHSTKLMRRSLIHKAKSALLVTNPSLSSRQTLTATETFI